jgi:hypothetical protein
MTHHSFIQSGAFGPVAIATMSAAFEAACKALDDTGQPELVLDIIAERIVAAARTGEHDPVRLRESRAPLALPRSRLAGTRFQQITATYALSALPASFSSRCAQFLIASSDSAHHLSGRTSCYHPRQSSAAVSWR